MSGLRSKSWEEFAGPGAAALDFVFTVCDNAADEVCPVWPGQPMTAHWGVPDPSLAEGSETERRLAFADTHAHVEPAHRHLHEPALPLPRQDVVAESPRRDRPHAAEPRRRRNDGDLLARVSGSARSSSARHSCWRPSSARASWVSGWLAAMSRWRCWATRFPTGAILFVLITMLGPDIRRALQSGGDRGVRRSQRAFASPCSQLRRRADARRGGRAFLRLI